MGSEEIFSTVDSPNPCTGWGISSKAGSQLSDGQTAPADIFVNKRPFCSAGYVVNEIQEVYRLQGVKINDKHIEVIVRQMMRKLNIVDPGDTRFLEEETVDKFEFLNENGLDIR